MLASLMKTIKPMTHRLSGVGKVTRGPSEHITITFAANVLRSLESRRKGEFPVQTADTELTRCELNESGSDGCSHLEK